MYKQNMKMKRPLLFFLTILSLACSSFVFGQTVNYGFLQNAGEPLEITAVAYPSYTSNDVTISTAVFTFLLPSGTVTNPDIDPAPAVGSFNDITGI